MTIYFKDQAQDLECGKDSKITFPSPLPLPQLECHMAQGNQRLPISLFALGQSDRP